MTLETIESLHAKHQGKVSDKWASYLREYQRFLAPFMDRHVRLLEIGVQNGGSLELWAQVFPKAECIVGCDIAEACGALRFDDPRISVEVGDANADATERAIAAHASTFDIIIDDGSHTSSDIVRAFARYFPRLADGGIYIVEDLHCSYWQEFEGGLFHPTSSMTFLKRLADVVNHQHWGVPRRYGDVLRPLTEHFGVSIRDETLASVHSIEFVNSLCAIRKANPEDNELGERRITGSEATVSPETSEARSMTRLEAISQINNPWANGKAPEEELADTKATLVELKEQVQAMHGEQEIAAQERARHEQQLAALRTALAQRDHELASTTGALRELAMRAATSERERAAANRQMDKAKHQAQSLERELADIQAQLTTLRGSRLVRMTSPLRHQPGGASQAEPRDGSIYRAGRRIRKVVRQKGVAGAASHLIDRLLGKRDTPPSAKKSESKPRPSGPNPNDYAAWLNRYDRMTEGRRAGMAARIERFAKKPLISILVPTYNTDRRWLSAAIESVRAQVYPHWELCIADDASTDPKVRELLEHYSGLDPRIKVVFRPKNGHISAASNSALELATGEWTALLDHDDQLTEHALFWVVEAINRVDDVRMLYSDEDKVDEKGERCHPYFKCDWNEDLFRSHNMFSHLGVFQTSLLRDIGGFRVGYEGSQDWDLVWRCLERVERRQIHHIPRVLYSWRIHAQSTSQSIDSKPYAVTAGQKAMAEHFERTGVQADVDLELGGYRVRYKLPAEQPLVTILIPTRNAHQLVTRCIDSIVERTTYDNYEILLIDNGSDDPASLRCFAELARRPGVRVMRDEQPFNYSALNNAGVQAARGEIICLMNNDIEVITPKWLSEMVSVAIQPGVGAVGARLWFPNNTLQHGGVILGVLGVANHAHKFMPRGQYGYFGRAILRQSFTCVTAACLVVRKSSYLEVGGLNEVDLKVAYNDVDFCLKLVEAGYRNVWTPYADLYHHESATRGLEDDQAKKERLESESAYVRTRWGNYIAHDPAYNPNLSVNHVDFSYAWPPRIPEY